MLKNTNTSCVTHQQIWVNLFLKVNWWLEAELLLRHRYQCFMITLLKTVKVIANINFPLLRKGLLLKLQELIYFSWKTYMYTLKHINSCRLNNKLVIELASLLIHQYVHVYTPWVVPSINIPCYICKKGLTHKVDCFWELYIVIVTIYSYCLSNHHDILVQ